MDVFAEKFDDIKILRFEVPGFENLDLNQKKYIYYLSQATLAGRDILWDQHGADNILVRDLLEGIYTQVNDVENKDWDNFEIYLKKVWFSSGVHHHYSTDKFIPAFSKENFRKWLCELKKDEKLTDQHLSTASFDLVEKIIFDPDYLSKRVNTKGDEDVVATSANNFYSGLTQKEVEDYYAAQKEKASNKKVSFGLNSRLVKKPYSIVEEIYKSAGLYNKAIDRIVENLTEAVKYAENDEQVDVLIALINFYESGDLEQFDAFCINWVSALGGDIDFINGFIETYGDPMGMKATWEGVVQLVDKDETKKAEIIAENAGWFDQNAPIDESFHKDEIKGISLKAISAVMLGGDCYPASPLGINLPNAEWIRETYGSKSVTLTNISTAHHKASLSTGFTEEFTLRQEDVELEKKYGAVADNLHTHLHECIGHGSGKMLPGVTSDSLKSYGSVIEEARADLYGLYYMYDAKMIELGLLSSLDAAKAHYNSYIRNGLLTQITRIKLGDKVEQAHMRNRQMICKWVFEKGDNKVIERIVKGDKTYYVINDYEQLHSLFGDLLKEIQRIKSTGDYKAAMDIVETYGVQINLDLHKEVLKRYETLGVPPFSGFLNPAMELKMEGEEIVDVMIDYDTDYAKQMLDYSMNFNFVETFK